MSDPFIAEINMFAGNFAPRGWAFCSGQLLPIAQNTALFSLLGTTYGGDGRTTFQLPDLQGRLALHEGNGPGLAQIRLGQRGGAETAALTVAQMPNHQHTVAAGCSSAGGADANPTNHFRGPDEEDVFADSPGANETMKAVTSASIGGGLAHTNVQPYTCVNYIIATQGVFPSRS